jgi:GNAT superfamily N-acetyltransferase
MNQSLVAEAATFSPLESERFGVRAARASITADSLPRVLDFCAAEKINFLIARCATGDPAAVQSIEMHGFLLMDTLVYYGFDLSKPDQSKFDQSKKAILDDARGFLVRPFRAEDANQVRIIAAAAFRDYKGHYHADPRLERHLCDEAYISWAERSITEKAAADEVLVAEQGGNLAGFITLRRNSSHEIEGPLFAVAPEHQKRGVGRALMIHSLAWSHSQGAQRMVISTQVTNVAVQKVWSRLGFAPSHSYYTFHKWFD